MNNTRVIMNVIIASLMGIALCLLVKALYATRDLQSNMVYIAELNQAVLPGQLITAESLISELPMVQASTVRVIDKDAALEHMVEDMPELIYLSENPFRNIISFQTKGIHSEEYADLEESILAIEGVDLVFYDKSLTQVMHSSLSRPRLGMILVALLIAMGTFGALCLRVRRDLREYQAEMKILSLAGADHSAISSTRLKWSVKWGFISSLVAAIVTLINIYFINITLLHGMEISFLQGVVAVLFMIGLVVLAHAIITHFTIKQYLTNLNPSIQK